MSTMPGSTLSSTARWLSVAGPPGALARGTGTCPAEPPAAGAAPGRPRAAVSTAPMAAASAATAR
ncbi:MAG TPA: hypothetical protein VKV35_13830 [Streptosporangiaceae bacterium]|nr:hypothetical protein [Streptosporangiaceae bacterium]